MNKIYLFFVLVFCFSTSNAQKKLFSSTDLNYNKSTLQKKQIKEYDSYTLYRNYQRFDVTNPSISVTIEGKDKSFTKNYSYTNHNGYLVWQGSNKEDDQIILLQKNGRIVGSVSSDLGEYDILTYETGTILLGRVSEGLLVSECDTEPELDTDATTPVPTPTPTPIPGDLPIRRDEQISDVDGISLDVRTTTLNVRKIYKLLFAYTPEFADFYNFNQDVINDILELIVERMNETYITNQSQLVVRLAFSYMTTDSETGSKGNDLTLFRFGGFGGGPGGPPNAPQFDEVFQYEADYNIEASILLVNTNYGGRAARSARKAVASRRASVTNFTAAHEIGHLLGLEHERDEFNWFERVIGGLDRKRAYGHVGNTSRSVMATNGNTGQTRRALYSDPFFDYPEGDQSGNDHAKASYRIRVKPWNVVRKADRLNENLNNITITSDQTYHTFAYNSVETSNYVTQPSSRVQLSAANSIKLKAGTKLSQGSTAIVRIQQGPFEETVFSRAQNTNLDETFYEDTEIEEVEDFYTVYGSGRKTVTVDVRFPEEVAYRVEIVNILTGQKLISEGKESTSEKTVYNLSNSRSTYIAVSLIFDRNIVKTKKIRL